MIEILKLLGIVIGAQLVVLLALFVGAVVNSLRGKS